MRLVINEEIANLQARLGRIGRRLHDLRPVMGAIGVVLEGSTRQRFGDEIAPDGSTWARLLPKSVARKARNQAKVLTEFGDLMRSITHHSSAYALVVGTDRHYGAYHQMGTSKMVARPFLGISDADKTEIDDVLGQFIQGALHG